MKLHYDSNSLQLLRLFLWFPRGGNSEGSIKQRRKNEYYQVINTTASEYLQSSSNIADIEKMIVIQPCEKIRTPHANLGILFKY